MSVETATPASYTPEQEALLKTAYIEILQTPFDEIYEDKWEEDTFWSAVEVFKARTKEIGLEDPFVILSKYKIETYEYIRDDLKAGPPACTRPGWKSPFLGTKVDTVALIGALDHLAGPKFTGVERVVAFDFWATWCGPCVRAGGHLSDLSEKYAGRAAIVGVNNERRDNPRDVAKVSQFLEEHKDTFRYTNYIDSAESLVSDSVWKATEYKFIPCVVVTLDGVVTYVGAPDEHFEAALETALATVENKEE